LILTKMRSGNVVVMVYADAVFSFHPVIKHIACGEGGAITKF
jgi:dTDP-4-amino-4,6-dideoxygalactose transaminase